MEHEHSFIFMDSENHHFLMIPNFETGKSTCIPLSPSPEQDELLPVSPFPLGEHIRIAKLVNVAVSPLEKRACLMLQKDATHPEESLKTIAFLSEKELSKLILLLQNILCAFRDTPDPLDPSSL